MKFQSIISAIFLALLAAIGNFLFTYGQKKSHINDNPMLFGVFSLLLGGILLFIASLFLPKSDILGYAKDNYKWLILGGIGYSVTSVSIYLLYTNYGVSYYVVYAILSIILISIILAAFVFKEKLNFYYLLSIFFGIITIVLFVKGKQ